MTAKIGPTRVLGIDPGWAFTGYAIVVKDAAGQVRVDTGGVIKPQLKPSVRKQMKRRSKAELAARTFQDIVCEWRAQLTAWEAMHLQPDLVAVERYLPFGVARTSGHMASEYQGMLFGVCASHGLPVQWTTPAAGQKLVLGDRAKAFTGKACKAEMVKAAITLPGASALFAAVAPGQHEHLADAIAAGMVGLDTPRPDWEKREP